MIPYVDTPLGRLYSFPVMAAIATAAMFLSLHMVLKGSNNRKQEEIFISIKIVISGFAGVAAAALLDALFKIPENGGFKLMGITFYGGLLGSVACMYILLRFGREYTRYSVGEWFNLLTVPLIVFHFFGRIGCFLAGCCYGKATDCFLGVAFPDNPDTGVFHNGARLYPTQLFEAAALLIILAVVIHCKNKFKIYLLSYAAARLLIEFFRGDDRGVHILGLSPAQLISIIILLAVSIHGAYLYFNNSDNSNNSLT